MAETDITLTVGLDPKSINQQIADLKKEIERQMTEAQKAINKAGSKGTGDTTPTVTPQVDMSALEEARAQIQQLQRDLNALEQGMGSSTAEYLENLMYSPEAEESVQRINELLTEAEALEAQLAENPALEEVHTRLEAIGQEIATTLNTLRESGQVWERPTQEVEQLTARVAQLELQLRDLSGAQENAGQNLGGMIAGLVGGGPAGGGIQVAQMLSKTINNIFRSLKRIAATVIGIVIGVRGIQSIINKIRGMIKEGFKAIYEGDKKFKKQVDDLKKSWAEIKANLAAAFMPIIQLAIPYIKQLIDWINMLISKLAMFIAAIAGQKAYTRAIKATGDAAKGAAKQLSKLDELNNLTTNGEWSTEQVPIDAKMLELAEKFKAILAEIKRLFEELIANPFKEGFDAAIGDWRSKIDTIKENIKGIGQSLIEVFSNPEVSKAVENYIKSISKLDGAIAGLIANAGLNVAMAFTGGIDKFLKDDKGVIQQDIVDMFTIDTENAEKTTDIVIAMSQVIDQIGQSESAVGAVANSLSIIWNIFVLIKESASELIGIFLDLFGPAITENVNNFSQLIETYFNEWEGYLAFWKDVTQTLKETIVGLFEAVRPIFEEIGHIIADVVGYIIQIYTEWIDPIIQEMNQSLTEMWNEYIDPILQDVIAIVQELVAALTPILTKLWQEVLKPTLDWLIPTLGQILVPIISSVWQLVVYVLKTFLNIFKFVFDLIKEVVGFVVAVLRGDVPGAVEHLKGIFGAFIEFISNSLKIFLDFVHGTIANIITLVTGIVNFIRGVVTTVGLILKTMLTTIGQVFENIYTTITEFIFNGKESFKGFWTDIVNMAINALNSLIKAIESGLNKILGSLSSTGISDFVGDKLHINIPTSVSLDTIPNIPGLAQGAVIPPSMGDFIARLGDNNAETEIVSPISTMKQALMEAMQEMGGSGEYHIHVDVDGREIAKAVVRQNDIYRKSTGKGLLAY